MFTRKKLILFITLLMLLICNVQIPAVASNRCQAGQSSGQQLGIAGRRISLTDQEAWKIGQMIWNNESGAKTDGLTAWNEGEDFASLGIAHFIWYPTGRKGPFTETFPDLLNYIKSQGISLPDFLSTGEGCPWPDRAAFMKDFSGKRMLQLRSFLAATIMHQVRFAALRLENALRGILAAAPANDRSRVHLNFYRVAAEPTGFYALMDYVNFKGEGTSPAERYQGRGWGLLQVLQEMKDNQPLSDFSQAACRVLARRVAGSPPERNEARWLKGWQKRCQTYSP